MALGYKETDEFYDNLVRPVLRRMGMTSRRVDRITHNKNIDDKIIEEIVNCDLALADLTYARPSVYYEAGFAERKVPVVYTCKADHLDVKAHPDDEWGHFRIHFDLSTRNIISWRNGSDAGFAERLERRLRHITRPILNARERDAAAQAETSSFDERSEVQKLQLVLEEGKRVLQETGYVERHNHPLSWIFGGERATIPPHRWAATTSRAGCKVLVFLCTAPRLPATQVETLSRIAERYLPYRFESELANVRRFLPVVIACTLKSVNPSSLAHHLNSYSRDARYRRFLVYRNGLAALTKLFSDHKEPQLAFPTVVVVDKVLNVGDVSGRLSDVMRVIDDYANPR